MAYALQENAYYYVYAQVTNQSISLGEVPVAAKLTVTITSRVGGQTLLNTTEQISFLAGETKVIQKEFFVPSGTTGQSGSLSAKVTTPDGRQIASAAEDVTILLPPPSEPTPAPPPEPPPGSLPIQPTPPIPASTIPITDFLEYYSISFPPTVFGLLGYSEWYNKDGQFLFYASGANFWGRAAPLWGDRPPYSDPYLSPTLGPLPTDLWATRRGWMWWEGVFQTSDGQVVYGH